jgi:undecaprenyl-phosphate galactose phosphotransferase
LKRTFDVTFALLLLLCSFWLCAVLFLLVKITQGGPVIYRHRRVGLYGREFDCLKFRTMIRNSDQVLREFLDSSPAASAEWNRDFKLQNDPRITPLGRFLRKSSLDELPQLWNVLRGEMSMVGPRPVTQTEMQTFYGRYAAECLTVRPGLTGPWQVDGRHLPGYAHRVELDVDYARHWTVLGDVRTIAKTVGVVLSGKGAR